MYQIIITSNAGFSGYSQKIPKYQTIVLQVSMHNIAFRWISQIHEFVYFTTISTDQYNCCCIRLILWTLFQNRLGRLAHSLTNG
jgi:hypothetical protein